MGGEEKELYLLAFLIGCRKRMVSGSADGKNPRIEFDGAADPMMSWSSG